MKKLKLFQKLVTKKLLRQELAKLLLQNEHLKSQLISYREREKGFDELTRLYAAVIAYLGEALEKGGLLAENAAAGDFDVRAGRILSLLKNGEENAE